MLHWHFYLTCRPLLSSFAPPLFLPRLRDPLTSPSYRSFLPALVRKGPSLIPTYLRILLYPPIAPHHPDTKAALQYLIPTSLDSIGLTHNDLYSLDVSPRFNPLVTEHPQLIFLSAVHECARHELAGDLDRLLETATTLLRDRNQVDSPIKGVSPYRLFKLAGTLRERVASSLGEHNTPPTPAIRALFETSLDAVNVPRPATPPEGTGWHFWPVGCVTGYCAPCRRLGSFLTSDTRREVEISAAVLTDNLMNQLEGISTRIEVVRAVNHRNKEVLTVKKLEREPDALYEEHDARMKQWRGSLAPLTVEYFKVVLGDEGYRRLIDPGPGQSEGVASDGQAVQIQREETDGTDVLSGQGVYMARDDIAGHNVSFGLRHDGWLVMIGVPGVYSNTLRSPSVSTS